MSQKENGKPSQLDNDLVGDEPTAIDLQIEKLQESLEREKDARKEERFLFIVVFILLFDIVFFTVMPTFGGPIALLLLELIVLLPLAKRLGMEEIAGILDRVLSRIANSAGNGSD